MRRIIESILVSVGFEDIQQYVAAVDALRALQHEDPDLILVDFQMESLDGCEFTRYVRGGDVGRNPYVPIIMISGHTQKSTVEAARDAGITEYVAKPLTAQGLLSRINTAIQTPRPFIRCGTYFGPDRRRSGAKGHRGPFRRRDDRNEVAL